MSKLPEKEHGADLNRRGFLKMLGVGAATAATVAIVKAVPALPQIDGKFIAPITEKCNGFVEVEKSPFKPVIPVVNKDGELNKGIAKYLRQKDTDRIYVYSRTLAERPDMVEVAPVLAEKLYDDTIAMQKLEKSWNIELEKKQLPLHERKHLMEQISRLENPGVIRSLFRKKS